MSLEDLKNQKQPKIKRIRAVARPKKISSINSEKPRVPFLGLGRLRNVFTLRKRVSAQSIADFFDQLNTLLNSGVALLQSLDFVRSATKNQKLARAIQEISSKMRAGAQLSEAMTEHPEIFDRIVLGMIRAAEASGRLEIVCAELARSFAHRAEMQSRILQALSYPFLVASVGFVTVFVLLVFVVPKLTTVFELWDTKLPLVTQILLGTSSFLSKGGFVVPFAALALVLFLIRILPEDRRKRLGYSTVEKLPYINRMFFLTDFVRLARTWGMLMRSGVPLIEAIRSSKDVLWNPDMQSSMDTIREKTLRGASLQETVHEVVWFPELAHNFLSVGEATGTLDESFDKIASFYERELDRKVKLMGTFLEPMLILVIGLVVGFLVISLLLPIFEMSLVVK